MTYEVRSAGYRVASDDGSTNPGEELLAGDNLLAEKVAAALSLHLVLDVQRRDTGAGVLGHGARNHRGPTESANGCILSTGSGQEMRG